MQWPGMARWRRLATVAALLLVAAPIQAATSFADIVDRVRPSVVGIGTFDILGTPPNSLHGTGFVVGNGSLVATNLHVVEAQPAAGRSKSRLVVYVGRGPQAEQRDAEVVATDSAHDLALLRIAGGALPALQLDPDQPVREGNGVAFTGFPIGAILGLYPVTHRGMVSALTPIATSAARAKDLSRARIAALRDPYEVIQLDAVAYPGNSGSPLYRRRDGAVVGIINQVLVKHTKEDMLRDPSAISYAIPVRFLVALMATLPAPP
ncbi:MAG: trypsin-like peptidase domain-containing protein [Proteobacteria bacterium]|nr:trypsin-like peptidase domain-containing protein [Pseudomonadota bacterium]